MKKLLPLLILVFTVSAFGQDDLDVLKTLKNLDLRTINEKIAILPDKGNYTYEYDKFKDRSFVDFSDGVIHRSKTSRNPAVSVQMQTTFTFAGKELPETANRFTFIFRAPSYRGWNFLYDHSLTFLADGGRIPLGEGSRNSSISQNQEWLYYTVLRSDLETLANAKTLEMQLGSFEASISEKQRRGLQNILKLSTR